MMESTGNQVDRKYSPLAPWAKKRVYFLESTADFGAAVAADDQHRVDCDILQEGCRGRR